MFNQTYNSGKIKYTVTFTPTKAASKWSAVTFMGTSTNISLRSNESSTNPIWGYTTDGTNVTSIASSAYSANVSYTVTLIVDYDTNTVKISLGDTEVTVSGITPQEIKGIKFMTAKTATDRSFTVSEIKIEIKD